jgi:multiple sugar transport system permease protein
MIFYILVTSVIGAFKIYNQIVALFGVTGKPEGVNYTMQSIVMYIYQFIGGTNNNLGVAAAGSLILFAIILVLTLIQMQVSKKRVHY